MKEPSFTLGSRWLNHYFAGAALLHRLLGHPAPAAPVSSPEPETLKNLLQDVAGDNYVPGKYFGGGGGQAQNSQLATEAPPADLNETYLMITVNVHSSFSKNLSGVYSGGVIYEEPVWAMLAALSIARAAAADTLEEAPLVIPRAADNAVLWQNLSKVSTAINSGQYDAEKFFSPAEAVQPGGGKQPAFKLVSVRGNYVQLLRENGRRTIPAFNSPRFFEFYTRA